MRIPISGVEVDGKVCVEVEVSVAVSNSVAVRAVPVDADGVEYPDHALAVVGDGSDERIGQFMAQVAAGAAALLG